MDKNIINDRSLFDSFVKRQEAVPVKGVWKRTILRADGSEEVAMLDNIVISTGLDALANKLGVDTTSAFIYMAVGTVTAAASLGSTVTGFGEIDRKASSQNVTSAEVAIQVATWAGNADGISGVPLGSAALVNHASSGEGIALNIVNSVAATLGDSDFLRLEMTVQIGSHAI